MRKYAKSDGKGDKQLSFGKSGAYVVGKTGKPHDTVAEID